MEPNTKAHFYRFDQQEIFSCENGQCVILSNWDTARMNNSSSYSLKRLSSYLNKHCQNDQNKNMFVVVESER